MIKFNSNSIPSYVRTEKLTDIPHPSGLTFGYWVKVDKDNDQRIIDGDFIEESGAFVKVLKAADVTGNILVRAEVAEILGKQAYRNLQTALDGMGLTDAQEWDLNMRSSPAMIPLLSGFLGRAKKIAENTPIAGQLTLPRRTAIVNEINAAIALLG